MKLRPYQSKDFDAVIRLWWDSWHSSSDYKHPKSISLWENRWRLLERDHEIVVIEMSEKIVAFAALDLQGCILSQIFVLPEYKRRGIGSYLIKWVSSKCKMSFSLKTASNNVESRAFYESLGMKKIGTSLNDFNGREETEYKA